MSDPMTNSDIEDVLSSIRRLVSQEHSDATSDARPDAARDSDDAGRGRLLLTPAQRVAEVRDAGASGPSGANSQSAPESASETAAEELPPPEAGETRASLEKTIAELEAAVSVYEEEWEPDGSEAAAVPPAASEDGPDHPAATQMQEADAQAEPAPPSEAQAPDAPEPDDSAGGAARPEQPDNVWPFTVEKKVQGGTAADEVPVRDPAGVGNFASTPVTAQFYEPGEEDDLEAVLDEETLRDLVAEIVREELQGELGERITRNVRKLVRSEIARALASRTLEQ